MEKSFACTAYDGRYLMMGFASDKSKVDEAFVVPRKVMGGNFKLCGVLLAYAPEPAIPLMKKGLGWNFCPNTLGAKIMAEIVEGVREGELRPVIGQTIGFDALPEGMHALFERKTLGRVLARLD